MKQTFKAKLSSHGPGGAWVFINIPFDVEKVFHSKARVPVCGSINGSAFRNSLLPNGDGTHSMAVNKALQAGAGAQAGDTVTVIMQIDAKKRLVELPLELAAALKADEAASTVYRTLAPSHQKEFADWVGTAKQATTRVARAAKALTLIRTRAHTR